MANIKPKPTTVAEELARRAISHVTHPGVPVSLAADTVAGLLQGLDELGAERARIADMHAARIDAQRTLYSERERLTGLVRAEQLISSRLRAYVERLTKDRRQQLARKEILDLMPHPCVTKENGAELWSSFDMLWYGRAIERAHGFYDEPDETRARAFPGPAPTLPAGPLFGVDRPIGARVWLTKALLVEVSRDDDENGSCEGCALNTKELDWCEAAGPCQSYERHDRTSIIYKAVTAPTKSCRCGPDGCADSGCPGKCGVAAA